MKRAPRKRLPAALKARGIALARRGASATQIQHKLKISNGSAYRLVEAAKGVATVAAKVVRATRVKPRLPKASPMETFLKQQLAEVAEVIRAAMPDLTAFTLTTTKDGNTNIEYSVRQTSEVSGKITL